MKIDYKKPVLGKYLKYLKFKSIKLTEFLIINLYDCPTHHTFIIVTS